MYYLTLVILSLFLAFNGSHAGVANDGSDVCRSLFEFQNEKTKWPFHSDCHRFYNCSILLTNRIASSIKMCPEKHFFNFELQTCVPEGPIPCQDLCQDENVRQHGCFALPDSCSTFFLCIKNASSATCCPQGFRFDHEICKCTEDPTCIDNCLATGTAGDDDSAEEIFDFMKANEKIKKYCTDSFGNTLMPKKGDETSFYYFDGFERIPLLCGRHKFFDVNSCACVANSVRQSKCSAYFPFDDDFKNHHQLNAIAMKEVFGQLSLDKIHSAKGHGSLRSHGGHLLLEGLDKVNFAQEASVCLFYQCAPSKYDPRSCFRDGTLLKALGAKRNCQFELTSPHTNEITANLTLQFPDEKIFLKGSKNAGASVAARRGFQQVCLVSDGSEVSLFVNKALSATAKVKISDGFVKLRKCQLGVGKFIGNIDELLICNNVLDADEINAHYDGGLAMKEANLI